MPSQKPRRKPAASSTVEQNNPVSLEDLLAAVHAITAARNTAATSGSPSDARLVWDVRVESGAGEIVAQSSGRSDLPGILAGAGKAEALDLLGADLSGKVSRAILGQVQDFLTDEALREARARDQSAPAPSNVAALSIPESAAVEVETVNQQNAG